ncbi:polar amino acid transport system permease protein [Paucidesulfovibrio gracilis DSM 16080]|uniref:Putative glutamine transport system permease protein GlnP n=1 Tax=Paucidesulfovibrio gracilis DSM 16080 TaxID=1121449 RepID=A0A1T4W3D3_9BACT|nr:amino acid ABC transporter permease [Paucidesulfovibrio gracilis]SKA71804.1 polar amino acid transport system permease protein [Paucidesulfovibrio gracilis DSM 16080]
MDFSLVWKHHALMLKGMVTTLECTSGAISLGLILGIVAGIGVISDKRLYRWISDIYVQVIRGTPLLLQIFFFYLGGPQVYRAITGDTISPDPLITGILALGVNSGGYTAEIIRAGIQSIGTGQTEAALSSGLNKRQTMIYIILPQALRRMIPPLFNELIVLLKDSSLISTIGVADLMFSAKLLGSKYYNYVPFLLGAALIYLTLTVSFSRIMKYLERRWPVRL